MADQGGLLRRIGRKLQPLLDADADARERRDAKLMQLLAEHERTQRALQRDLERQREETARMRGHIETLETSHLPQLRDALRQVRGSVTRQERILKRTRVTDRQFGEQQRVLWRLDHAVRSERPLLAGPWTGEVGFELLYWIPFLRWAIEQFRIDPARITVVSRGGPRAWYDGLCGDYLDALDLVDVPTFREQTTDRKKQRLLGQFDRRLIRHARNTLGRGPMNVLHPGMMYALFMPYWKRQASLQRVLDHTTFAPLGTRRDSPLPGLPARYVAVRFYFSSCFPETPENRAFATQTIRALAQEHHVVLLDPGLRIDDHRDADAVSSSRVHVLPEVPAPSRNLDVQTQVIRGADAFVGTYGGYAYLAPFYGVDALAFHSDRNFRLQHLELAELALQRVGGGRLQVIDVAAAGLVSASFGRATHLT